MSKNVIVTGAAGGMGAAICKKLVANNWNVFAIDIRPLEMEGVTSFCCDMTNVDDLEKTKNDFLKITDKVDAIVHAAGIYDLDAFSEMDDERFTRIFEINVFGAYRINRIFTPYMSDGGRITIITSELAPLNPLPFTGIYAVTKAALDKYAYSLRSELALRGIKVTVIRPGAVKTGLLNVSTTALDRFVANTKYFAPNAKHFKDIVDHVEAKSVAAEKIGKLVWKSLTAKKPKFVYSINRNVLLRIMSALPDHFQVWILKVILK